MVKSLTRNVLGCGLAILLLSSCSSFQTVDPVVISTKPLDRPELILPPTDQLTMRDVEWVIITEENYAYEAYYKDSEEVINSANDQLKELDGKKLGITE